MQQGLEFENFENICQRLSARSFAHNFRSEFATRIKHRVLFGQLEELLAELRAIKLTFYIHSSNILA